MDIRINLPGIEFARQEAGLTEKQIERIPDLRVELVNIFDILQHVFPERLFDVERILSALRTIHSLQFASAILAIGISRRLFAADTLQAAVFNLSGEFFPEFI